MNAGDCNGRSYAQGKPGFKMFFLKIGVFIYLDNVVQVTEARRQQSRISAAALLRHLPMVSSPPRAILSAVSCRFPLSPQLADSSQHSPFLLTPTQSTPSRWSSAVTTSRRAAENTQGTAAGRRSEATPWTPGPEGKRPPLVARFPARIPLLRDPSDYPTGSSSARCAVWCAPDPTC